MIKRFFNKKQKVVFRTTSGKKICTVKFTNEQFDLILLATKTQNITLQEFFTDVIKAAARPTAIRKND
jgi:hypothetical protein